MTHRSRPESREHACTYPDEVVASAGGEAPDLVAVCAVAVAGLLVRVVRLFEAGGGELGVGVSGLEVLAGLHAVEVGREDGPARDEVSGTTTKTRAEGPGAHLVSCQRISSALHFIAADAAQAGPRRTDERSDDETEGDGDSTRRARAGRAAGQRQGL